jgi:hypothetical protein
MQQARHQLRESLEELEHDTLGGVDMAAQQLDRALESVSLQDVELDSWRLETGWTPGWSTRRHVV